jgi:hypothetical protein
LVVELLAQDSALLSVEIFRRAKLAGYGGGKSALYDLIQAIRPKTPRPLVRFEGLPGEFSQHDFGQVDVRYLNGTKKRIHFFASRLKYSRWAEVTIVPDEQTETLVRTLVDHFAAIGGIPLLAVFDRPKTVALKWGRDGQVTEWNAVFAGVALDLGLGIEVCWPFSPETRPEHRAQHVAAVSGKRAKRYLQREHLLALGPPALEYLTELTHRRPQIWIRDVDRLHALLATYGEDAVRAALTRGLAEQAIGAEYIAHYLAAAVTTPASMEGDSDGRLVDRSSFLSQPGEPISRDEALPFDKPSANATLAPRGGRVQAAPGAPRSGHGATRSAWTRPSTALPFDADGGR